MSFLSTGSAQIPRLMHGVASERPNSSKNLTPYIFSPQAIGVSIVCIYSNVLTQPAGVVHIRLSALCSAFCGAAFLL